MCGKRVCSADVLMLMASGLETEPQSNLSTQEEDTLTPSNRSQTDSLSGSASGLERSESGLSLSGKLRRSSSSGQFNLRSPGLSPQFDSHSRNADSLTSENDMWGGRVPETEAGDSVTGLSTAHVQHFRPSLYVFYLHLVCLLTFPDPAEKEGVQFSEPQKTDFHLSFSRSAPQQSTSDCGQLKCPVYVYNCSLEHLKEQLVHPNSSRQPKDVFFR